MGAKGWAWVGRWLYGLWIISVLSACVVPPLSATAPRAEILWDTQGTPHIFAHDEESLLRALGWAQMARHGALLLKLYAQARGEGAAFFGPDYVAGDQTVHLLDIPAVGAQWYTHQPPAFQRKVDAFVAGINEYAAQHPETVASLQALLPLTGADLFRHWARVTARFAVEASECAPLLPGLSPAVAPASITDGWAIAPGRTAAGHALLLTNLHWPGDEMLTLLETQLVAPAINLSGVTLLGLPTLFAGFNDHLGWTHTRSRLDRCDLYALTLAGDTISDGYRLDGRVEPITTITHTLPVAQADGPRQSITSLIQRSAIGPVVEQNGQWLVLRLAGLTTLPADQILAQWWVLGKATDWQSFQQARPHNSFFNLLYADERGRVAAFAGGNVPMRPPAVTDWSLPVAGDQSSRLWDEALAQASLPQVVDPMAGWLQSSSGTPWYLTLPPLERAAYPYYPAAATLSASTDFLREQWALQFLSSAPPMTVATLSTAAFSTRSELAERILADIIAAAAQSDNATAQTAAAVLARWDRQMTADSRGAALFLLWYQHWVAQTFMKLSAANPLLTGAERLLDSALFYAMPWDPQAPLTTPSGLFSTLVAVQALASAATDLERMKLPLDATWADLNQAQTDTLTWPGNGALGVFGAVGAVGPLVGTNRYVAIIEFTQPVDAHSQQRPILRSRLEIEEQLAGHTLFRVDGMEER